MDKRKNNGGNSTKAKRPDDKRLNSAKQMLDRYIKEGFGYPKLQKLLDKLYKDALAGDTKSATVFMNYVLGKPKETKDIKVEVEKNFPDWLNETIEEEDE